MKKLYIAILIASLSVAYAKRSSACDNPRLNDYDRNYCLSKIYHEADIELNVKYKQLKSLLNNDGKRKLTRSEKQWITDRDNSCQNGSTTYLNCQIDYTNERTYFLQQRITECKGSGCMNSRLY